MSKIISAVTNIFSLIAFIILTVVFVLLKLRIIEQRLFRWLAAVVIVWLLVISTWMIYQNQTKQEGQRQSTPSKSQQPDLITETAKQPAISDGITVALFKRKEKP